MSDEEQWTRSLDMISGEAKKTLKLVDVIAVDQLTKENDLLRDRIRFLESVIHELKQELSPS